MDDKATSSDLADALAGNTKIIATTIHKFAQINKSDWMTAGPTAQKRFAILIDEAHSSTTGSYMSAVSQVLTETDVEDRTIDEVQEVSVADAIEQEIARTGKQGNISIIALQLRLKRQPSSCLEKPYQMVQKVLLMSIL